MGKKLMIGLVVGGLVLLAIGLIAVFVYPVIYDDVASLSEGTPVYDEWQEPDYPIYMKYFMYTYNNTEEVLSGQADKFSVEFVGILSYREYQLKWNISYEDDDKKVLYYNNKSYVFDEGTSTMNENDTVVVPNILMFTLLETVPKIPAFWPNLLNKWAKETDTDPELANCASPFYVVEAGNLLWGTKPNALLEALQGVPFVTVPSVYFGVQFNNTDDGLYEISTGKGNENKKRGIINTWDGSTTVDYWSLDSCNQINGSDGTIYPVNIPRDERLYIFNTQVCRSIFATSVEDQHVGGIKTTKFVAPSEIFEIDFEDNRGFCPDADPSKCLGNGLLDVSECYKILLAPQFGIQPDMLKISLVISSPEFLYCDNDTIDSIIGFDPTPEKHETFLNIERDSGVILKAAKRVQINTHLTKTSKQAQNLDALKNLADDWEYLVPLFWGEESLPEDDKLVHLVNESMRVTTAVLVLAYIFIAIGGIMLVAVVGMVVYSSTFGKKSDYDLDKEGLLRRQF